jgi:pimeloyl-ACP methyl ester carboxylesterase
VVLLHGSMDRAASWARVAGELRDHHVARYDRRGYGRSPEGGPPGGLAAHVDDLLTVVDGRPSVAVGHSYGGVVALVAAERRPDLVRGVVAFEAPMPWREWWPRTTPGGVAVSHDAAGSDAGDAAEAFLRRMLGDERWEALPAPTRRQRRAEGVALVAELSSLRGGPPPYVPERIEVPVVVGRGTRSPPHLREAADVLAAEVRRGELHVVAGASHGAHRSHPAELAALVRRALVLAGPVPPGTGLS